MPISHSKTVAKYLSDLQVPLLKFKFQSNIALTWSSWKGTSSKTKQKKEKKSATLLAILEAYCPCRYTKT